MPSPLSSRRNTAAALFILIVVLTACGGTTPEPKAPPSGFERLGVPTEERAFLVDPLEGYPLVVAAALEADVGGLYRTLGSGDQAAAAAGAASLLAENPGFHPAQVLLAQARFVERRYDAAREMLTPVTAELPTYTAAQLLVGRVAEILGDLPAAYAAYGQIAAVSPLAAESGVAMRPRATASTRRCGAVAWIRRRLNWPAWRPGRRGRRRRWRVPGGWRRRGRMDRLLWRP